MSDDFPGYVMVIEDSNLARIHIFPFAFFTANAPLGGSSRPGSTEI